MRNNTVVKRYARALLALGKADGHFIAYGEEMKALASALNELGDQAKALTSPFFPEKIRRKILTLVLEAAKLSPMVSNFIYLLMDKGHLDDLVEITEVYNALADEEQGVVRATVTSAMPLDKTALEAIRESLKKFVNRKVELRLINDPSIIGGLIAELGDLTIDGSVRTQIKKLSEQLNTL